MAGGVVLVQGASRGLGLHFCKHILSARKEARVIATCRSPEAASALQALQRLYPQNLTVLRLDATREAEIREAAEAVAKEHGRLDLLINSGAMLHPSGRGEKSLQEVSAEVTSGLRRKDMPPAGPHPMSGERSLNGNTNRSSGLFLQPAIPVVACSSMH
ncbi:benzil reductase ((S)-benzoin forming) IRC24-like, partial [Terrapene carolina triunguis]|uniref:benzil reductase ((S)-benzoin forming) IRC24-like n=1 Tax=Terrapene triunguis TaxID=2587831 RepID=UPI001156442E